MVPVYFTKNISAEGILIILKKIRSGLKGKTGIKLHFGEHGNKNYVSPELVKPLAEILDAAMVETNALYVCKRRYTESHLETALSHGFDFAPIDILDAEGESEYPADLKHYSKVKTGRNFGNYDSFLILSHFKGHILMGFGGAIKNVSMGFASPAGKMALHASSIPEYNPDLCTECGKCIRQCPGEAISIRPLHISSQKCIGCGKCIGVCPEHAFGVPWGSTEKPVFIERVCDYAKGFTRLRPMVFINVLAKISKDCDCDSAAAPPFIDDIGILASEDMLALERASLDLVNKAYGSNDTFLELNGVGSSHLFEYAESIGLGSADYEFVDISDSK